MARLPFRIDRKLTDVLARDPFTVSAEVIPPRNGAEQAKIIEQVDALIEAGAEFLAVTKGAGGSLRGGSLPIVQAIKEQFGVPCIAHFTCRDLSLHDVENQLMDHHYFGIRNILALRGDPPDGQPNWKPRPDGYNYAHELIGQIKALNQGFYLPREGGPAPSGHEKTDFCIGSAVYPEHPNAEERLRFFKLKVEAGAEYGITDMLFDPEAWAHFRDLCAQAAITVPILPGTRVLNSRAQATRMMQKFRVRVPDAILTRLPEVDSPDSIKIGTELFLEMTDRYRMLGAPGIHVFVIADTPGATNAIRKLKTAL